MVEIKNKKEEKIFRYGEGEFKSLHEFLLGGLVCLRGTKKGVQ